MTSDVRDILDLERPPTPELTREAILNVDKKKNKYVPTKAMKRPEGMHREVFALLYNDNKDAPPLLPTDTGNGYKHAKAKLGMRKVRQWIWAPFKNPARIDGAIFHHWKRTSDEPREYPFAQFNKKVSVPCYTDSEYSQYLVSEEWTRSETDHLLDLCRRFDLRFIVIADRWDRASFRKRSIEDLKERYYGLCSVLNKVKSNSWSSHSGERRSYNYDADHERRRKEQLIRLFDRTQEQVEEEQGLLSELKKIEARKRERERKAQDLQKLISRADGGGGGGGGAAVAGGGGGTAAGDGSTVGGGTAAARRHDRKLHRKKIPSHARPPKQADNISGEGGGIRFPEARGAGVWLRSQRMKLPPGVGQRKAKAIEQTLRQLHVDLAPTPTEAICHHFNELRSDVVLSLELRTALATCEFELQALRHQYEALSPGKTLTIPAAISSTTDNENKPSGEIIDVVGSPGNPSVN